MVGVDATARIHRVTANLFSPYPAMSAHALHAPAEFSSHRPLAGPSLSPKYRILSRAIQYFLITNTLYPRINSWPNRSQIKRKASEGRFGMNVCSVSVPHGPHRECSMAEGTVLLAGELQ